MSETDTQPADQAEQFGAVLESTAQLSELYLRVNVIKGASAYRHEMTASVRLPADLDTEAGSADAVAQIGDVLSALLTEGDHQARASIERQKARDAEVEF